MNKKIVLSIFAIVFLMMGFAHIAKAQVHGLPVPVITQAFASKEVWPGKTWKVYLNVSHPNGEMKSIYAIVDQPGVGQYPFTTIPIKEENRKELSGYIYLRTSSQWAGLEYVTLTLTIQVQDKSGPSAHRQFSRWHSALGPKKNLPPKAFLRAGDRADNGHP